MAWKEGAVSRKNLPDEGTQLRRCDVPGCGVTARWEYSEGWACITMPIERRQRFRRERDVCPEHAGKILDLLKQFGWLP